MPIPFPPVDDLSAIDPASPEIPGLRLPNQLYWVISGGAAPLAGMRLPSQKTPWKRLHDLGFRKVVCLCSERPAYRPAPLEWLVCTELSDLAEREFPSDPEHDEMAINVIAKAIVAELKKGVGVVVHCAGGRGRTGSVLGAALVRLGFPAEEAITYLDRVHRLRGKAGWPESPWQSEVVRRVGQRPS